jgi:uncharacterized membrane protein YdbT with pleckstrin-like domain
MPEQTVWHGTSSQWKNFGQYFLSAIVGAVIVGIFLIVRYVGSSKAGDFSPYILLLLVVPVFMALSRYLQTKNKIYELTTERLKTTEGVFSKKTDTLELYRVKDLKTHQPFLYRLVGIENVQMDTTDVSSPSVLIEAVPCAAALDDKVRNNVEAIRVQKGVREIDVE